MTGSVTGPLLLNSINQLKNMPWLSPALHFQCLIFQDLEYILHRMPFVSVKALKDVRTWALFCHPLTCYCISFIAGSLHVLYNWTPDAKGRDSLVQMCCSETPLNTNVHNCGSFIHKKEVGLKKKNMIKCHATADNRHSSSLQKYVIMSLLTITRY